MPRGPVVDKYVKGKLYSQRMFLNLVLDTLGDIVDTPGCEKGGRARDIADRFGDPAWQEPENIRLIAVTLINLKNRGFVKSLERGVYMPNETKIALGHDMIAQIEGAAAETLIENGGYAKRKHIDNSLGGARNSTDQRRVSHVLANSQRVRKEYAGMAYAIYNLPAEELAALPQMGKWLFLQTAGAMRLITGKPACEVYALIREALHHQYRAIGAAFKLAKKHIPEDFADAIDEDDDLYEAMKAFSANLSDRHHLEKEAIDRAYTPDGATYEELRRNGSTPEEIDTARRDALHDYDRYGLLQIMEWFEDGDPDAHEAAPLAFYYAFAHWAGLDATALSRGILLADLTRKKRIAKLDAREDGPLPNMGDDEDEPPEEAE